MRPLLLTTSLILLDKAHCSKAFAQTLGAVLTTTGEFKHASARPSGRRDDGNTVR